MSKPLELKDIEWIIKFMMMGEEEIKKGLIKFRNAVLEYNK